MKINAGKCFLLVRTNNIVNTKIGISTSNRMASSAINDKFDES